MADCSKIAVIAAVALKNDILRAEKSIGNENSGIDEEFDLDRISSSCSYTLLVFMLLVE